MNFNIRVIHIRLNIRITSNLFFTDNSKSEQEIAAFNHYKNLKKTLKERKNFASSNLGASILRNSKGVKSSKAILTNSNEQYMHIENCNNKVKESVVIILSDFVQVDTIMVSNREDFSAELNEVTFYGSVESPTNDAWFKIGSISPEQSQLEGHHGIHILEIKEQEQQWQSETRYLKVEMEGPSDNADGLFCTVTQVGIYGTSGYQVMRNSLLALERGNNTVTRPEPIQVPVITTGLQFNRNQGQVIDLSSAGQPQSKEYEWVMIQKDNEEPEAETCKPIYFMQSFASGIESELKAEFLSIANDMPFDLSDSQHQANANAQAQIDNQPEKAKQEKLERQGTAENEALGALFKKMVDKLNQNEEGQAHLLQQFTSQNAQINQALVLMNQQRAMQDDQIQHNQDMLQKDIRTLQSTLTLERQRHSNELLASNQRLEDLEQKVRTYLYTALGVLIAYILYRIVPFCVELEKSWDPSTGSHSNQDVKSDTGRKSGYRFSLRLKRPAFSHLSTFSSSPQARTTKHTRTTRVPSIEFGLITELGQQQDELFDNSPKNIAGYTSNT